MALSAPCYETGSLEPKTLRSFFQPLFVKIELATHTMKYTDLVPPFVAGYDTQFWFTNRPVPERPSLDEITAFGGIAAFKEVGLGIKAFAFENGMILFDFSTCSMTPVIIHREGQYEGLRQEESNTFKAPETISSQLARSEQKQSENQSFYRTIAVAHALLLENSARLVRGMSMSLPHIEDPSGLIYGYAPERLRSTVSYKSHDPMNVEIAKYSFELLSNAVSSGLHVVRSLELHKVSHYRLSQKNFAECLVMSWTLCENMIDFIWKKMISEIRSASPERMGKVRIDRLKGNSFTASVRIETLELSGLLNSDQAEGLNFVRKARNNWLHNLKEVAEPEALKSIDVCQNLISSLYSIPIKSTSGGGGGSGGGLSMDVFLAHYGNEKLKNAYDGS